MTLAEVLAALTVLSIGLVAMISLLPLAGSGVQEGRHRSGAVFLALQRLEQVRHTVGVADRESDPLNASAVSFPDEETVAVPHQAFSRRVRVRDCGLAPGCASVRTAGVRQVTVTVTYPASAEPGTAPTHRGAVTLSTYIGPR
jgi:Tfp pilus assembly protein PilV